MGFEAVDGPKRCLGQLWVGYLDIPKVFETSRFYLSQNSIENILWPPQSYRKLNTSVLSRADSWGRVDSLTNTCRSHTSVSVSDISMSNPPREMMVTVLQYDGISSFSSRSLKCRETTRVSDFLKFIKSLLQMYSPPCSGGSHT